MKARRWWLERGYESEDFAEEIRILCARDLLFWVNLFVWIEEPRALWPVPNEIPFITRGYQDDILMELQASVGHHDLLGEKSREVGWTWMELILATHLFCFTPRASIYVGSWKEEYVDSNHPKSLLPKIDFVLKRLPRWLVPRYTRVKKNIICEETGSTIGAEATNPDFGRAGRYLLVICDEFPKWDFGYAVLSSTRDTTRSRHFFGTPAGQQGAYFELREKGDIKVLRVHWTDDPDKRAGLYTSEHGKLVLQDEKYWFAYAAERGLNCETVQQFEGYIESGLIEYEFVLDGLTRSPYFDTEDLRTVNKTELQAELNIDYAASVVQFFPSSMTKEHETRYCVEPLSIGRLLVDDGPCEPIDFIEHPRGMWKLWIELGADGRPVGTRRYVIGVDVAAGTGSGKEQLWDSDDKSGAISSNSALSVVDRDTGEKVAEYIDSKISPEEYGRLAVAACKFFAGPDDDGAYLIYEANGPGRQFGIAVIDTGYRNLYFRTNESDVRKKKSMQPGWWATTDTQLSMLGRLRHAMSMGLFINRSAESLIQYGRYMFYPNGTVKHAAIKGVQDPSGATFNHGDIVVADGLAHIGVKERSRRLPSRKFQTAAIGSMKWRMENIHKVNLEKRELEYSW